jgi:hypothetical protein
MGSLLDLLGGSGGQAPQGQPGINQNMLKMGMGMMQPGAQGSPWGAMPQQMPQQTPQPPQPPQYQPPCRPPMQNIPGMPQGVPGMPGAPGGPGMLGMSNPPVPLSIGRQAY